MFNYSQLVHRDTAGLKEGKEEKQISRYNLEPWQCQMSFLEGHLKFFLWNKKNMVNMKVQRQSEVEDYAA